MEHEGYCFTIYADDTSSYVVANSTLEIVENLTNITQILFTCFANNQMKEKPCKCHLLVITQEEVSIQIANTIIESSRSQELLGIINFDNKLKFELYIGNICQKANKNLNALARPRNYIELPKRCILINAFFKAQFNCCPIVWMFHSRS